MRRHHHRIHARPVVEGTVSPQRECNLCGRPFVPPPSKTSYQIKYCSDTCARLSRTVLRSKEWTYMTCERCGAERTILASASKWQHHYCSETCRRGLPLGRRQSDAEAGYARGWNANSTT